MSLTKTLFTFASIAVGTAALPCYATVVPSSSVQLSIPSKYFFRAMTATFTPPGGLTLSAYAKALGYIGFDWEQTITNWPNSDLKLHNGTLIVPVPTPDPPFLDVPPGGYNYNPCGGTASGSSALASPFYFTPTGNTDCWSLVRNETPTANPTTLSFGDEPMDHQLTSAQIAANNIPMFTTALVGIESTDSGLTPSPAFFFWTWQTTYNGSAGGVNCAVTNGDICSRSANSPLLQPGEGGTGRVTITSINGVPVPEPPGSLLLASGVLAILPTRRMIRSKSV